MDRLRLQRNLHQIKLQLPKGVTLVAVSKYHSIDEIQALYDAGQRCFGESRAQELLLKYEALPKDIEWHFIGNLQSNKVKQIAPFVTAIHSVNSSHLLKEIEKQAVKYDRTIKCLLEVHVAQEESKQGMSPTDCLSLVKEAWIQSLRHVSISGVMGMASFTNDYDLIRREFSSLRTIFTHLKNSVFVNNPLFCELSMGMSSDFKIAIEEGSTMVRIGSVLFE